MTNKEDINNFVRELGIAYDAEFIPMKQDKEKNPQLHWRITLTRGHFEMKAEYKQGMGHVQGYQQYHKTSYDKRLAESCYRRTCETGKLYRPSETFRDHVIGAQPKPDLLDVLYCLISDSDVLNTVGFEDWADNYGYDRDSRQAEKTWQLCLNQTRDLLPVIGGYRNLDKFRELFQDY